MAWGDNSYGQCNVPDAATNVVAFSAGYYHSFALRADGTVVAWGKDNYGVTVVPAGLANVACVAAGEDFGLVFVRRGPPLVYGAFKSITAHISGDALLSATVIGIQPLSLQWFQNGIAIAGATDRFLVLSDIQSYAAGTYTIVVTNSLGEVSSYSIDVTLDAAPYIQSTWNKQSVPPGILLTLAPTIQGAGPFSYQWRRQGWDLTNDANITGANQAILQVATEFEDTGTYELIVGNASGLITGIVSQVFVTRILGWGENELGQLDVPFETRDIIAVSAGADHSLAVTSDGHVLAWGDNTYGQTNVPPQATNVVAVSAGSSHCMALRRDGTVIAWGSNFLSKTNVPASATNITAIAAGGSFSAGLRPNGTILTWGGVVPGSSSMTNLIAITAVSDFQIFGIRSDGTVAPGSFPGITNAITIAGESFPVCLQADGTVVGLGSGVAPPFSATNMVAVDAGGSHGIALRRDGTLFAWASGDSLQTNIPTLATNIMGISAGYAHNLALVKARKPSLRPTTSSGSMLLTLKGTMGRHYTIQYSTNLAEGWIDLTTITNLPANSAQVVDATASDSPFRFYRAIEFGPE